jgi:hypothetical protein
MTFWRIAAIRLRSHASRYDGVHAGYRYFQLHHSHAVSHGMTVVTSNLKYFSNVPGLKVEAWS